MLILTINPGSTSTKVALFDNSKELLREVLRYSNEQIEQYNCITDQLSFRIESIYEFIKQNNVDTSKIEAVVGRGGLLNPMPSGTYNINDLMKEHLKIGVQGEHASNLGGLMASSLAEQWQTKAYIVDPVAVDEMIDEARISGIPQLKRKCLSHALNIKAVSHRFANDVNAKLANINLVIAHLGGGISVVPLKQGKIIDVNNANDMGPFSPERAGTVPAGDLVKLCFSGEYNNAKEITKELNKKSGLIGYLGTNDLREVEKMIKNGNENANKVWHSMCYQIVKEIGRMLTVLHGEAKAIILTGGLAYSKQLTNEIAEYLNSFAIPIRIYPGEDELIALAEGAYRVLSGQEQAKEYTFK
ncbi:butyrate kinase [Clostridium sp. 'deep sea']|uniref:butyrate kinase n=1 Tax=Clostridium sp. 'deep sea' TaxID=2779445 RepID=UPI001A9B2868|nr:butyrate kinase [Clostridium sp. 'deep sea']